MITKNHHYFFLNFSPWPLICVILSFNFFFSLNLFFKFSFYLNFCFSLILRVFIAFIWWSDYLKEFSFLGYHSFDLEKGIKIRIILFISSEVFFFFSFFWSYFHFFLRPGLEGSFSWPPIGLVSFEAINLPLLNTLLLLGSGVLVTLSHWFLISGVLNKFQIFLILTIIFGFFFTFFQWIEYCNSFFNIRDRNFGSSFFLLTGFHGVHVILGSFFLITSLILSHNLTSSSKKNFLRFELACWYWHFVDVVWIFLFFFLYYLNN